MKTVVLSILMLFTCTHFTKSSHSLQPQEVDFNSKENFYVKDNLSSNNVDVNKSLKEFYEEKETVCNKSIKKYKDLLETIDNYVQRYVSLFLITSNLREYKIKDSNEMISMDLEISIKGEDLIYLQGYSKSLKYSSYPRNFYKLDAIFSKIARLKEKSFAENALKSSKSFFAYFYNFTLVNSPNFYQFLSFLFVLLMTWIVYHCLFHKSFFLFIGLTLNSMIFWESLNEYRKKIKEADIEIFVNTLNGVPPECNPANLRWYHSVLNLLVKDRCLQYYKNINKNPVVEVSLLKCIIDTYSFYIIRTPCKIYGAIVKDITEEISTLFPWPLRFIVNLSNVLVIAVVLALFILILCRKRLKLSFFGAALEIEDAQRSTENERPPLTTCEFPKTVRMIRKLRPWTKSRFPKRMEGNLGKRRKLFLKSSKSDFDSSSQDEQKSVSSVDKYNNTEIQEN